MEMSGEAEPPAKAGAIHRTKTPILSWREEVTDSG